MIHFDVFGIGNALLDTEYEVTDTFLQTHGISKGQRQHVDHRSKTSLLKALSSYPSRSGAGGSVANSIYAAQGFGCQSGFLGLLARDEEGNTYHQELVSAGIDVEAFSESPFSKTGHCLVLVTPDGERSMVTSLGVAGSLAPAHVNDAKIANSKYILLEGYLACTKDNRETLVKTLNLARDSDIRICLTLADITVIEDHRDFLREICEFPLEVLFGNVAEALSWSGTDSLEQALQTFVNDAKIAVVTVASGGCIVTSRTQPAQFVSGFPVDVVDSTGAGDMFAGAFLSGLVKQWDLSPCAKFANFAAAKIVTTFGARFPSIKHYASLLQEFQNN